jgi:hypothetical protein
MIGIQNKNLECSPRARYAKINKGQVFVKSSKHYTILLDISGVYKIDNENTRFTIQ